ncbi:hypothetical protein DH2020_024186 [Rehmannia glutinosa]|uniref:Agenet domain-containing protein n=1 Tax=Rehmannia glutinosa TaxID=99300 RepID=A0ABR0WAF9_REHGL
MAADSILQYFKVGADVEISSDDEGFRGSFYEGTVVGPPRKVRKSFGKVMVEYKTIMEDEAGKKPLREELELVQLRPPPPREDRRRFKFSEEVDAYYNDGWWEGTITEVVGEEDKYLVFFSGTREQIGVTASELRLHREWDYGKWVPPLEPLEEAMPEDEIRGKGYCGLFWRWREEEEYGKSAEVEANNKVIEHNYSPGDTVEASSNEEGFEGAWFAATILEKLKSGKYLVEYQVIMNDDNTKLLTEEVDSHYIRPCPPVVELVDRFEVHEEVDALYNDGWWTGVISKVLKNDRYSVYFSNTHEELKFEHSDLRPHQEWINGEWKTIKSIRCFAESEVVAKERSSPSSF